MMSRASFSSWFDRLVCWAVLSLCVVPLTLSSANVLKSHRTVYACENSTLRLQCAAGETIQLVRANFGRYSITICNEHGNTRWSVRCSSARAIFVLSDRCDQKQECSVLASESVFGDPCPNTLKYLEAHYKCLPAIAEVPTKKTPPPWLVTAAPAPVSTDSSFKPPPPPFAFTTKSTTSTTTTTTTTTATTTASTSTSTTQRTTSSTTSTISSSSSTTTTASSAAEVTASQPFDSSVPPHSALSFSSSTEEPSRAAFRPSIVVPGRSLIETHSHIGSHGELEDVTDIRHVGGDAVGPGGSLADNSATDKVDHSALGGHWSEAQRAALADSHCAPAEERHIFWNWTAAGQTAVERCPDGATGAALWRCSPGSSSSSGGDGGGGRPHWSLRPDLSECRSPSLSRLELQLKQHSSVLEVAEQLARATDPSSSPGAAAGAAGAAAPVGVTMYGGDLNMAVRLINLLPAQLAGESLQLPDESEQREAVVAELTKTVVSSTSNLLAVRQRPMWTDFERPERMAVVTSLMLGMEENAFLLATNLATAKSVMQSAENVVMSVRLLRTDWSHGPAEFPSADERRVLADFRDSISIPYAALQDNAHNSHVRLVFMFYAGMESILTTSADGDGNGGDAIDDVDGDGGGSSGAPRQIVNSRVVSASLGKGRHIALSEPATITLHHLRQHNVTNPRCVFWDYTSNRWSTDGCRVAATNRSHTRCVCSHLTNFAVLMDVHAVPLAAGDAWALELITYTGCGVSIVCLTLALLTFQLFRGVKSDRTSIHKNLCLCLLIGEVIFLAGINQTQQPILCGVVAGLLHYFFLCAFAWMFFEGFQLYVMLIEVFEAERSRLRWYYTLGYGAPAAIVAVSCLVEPHNYGTSRYCWLRSDNYFIFAFVGPVVAVILANLVFLGMAVAMMCRHSVATLSLKAKEQARLSSLSCGDQNTLLMKFQVHLAWIRGAVALVFLLGLTWALGLLYISQKTVAIAYAFTVCNSLQGLFIFVFHCVQNEKTRCEWARVWRQLLSWCSCASSCAMFGVATTSSSSGGGGGGSGSGDSGSTAVFSNSSSKQHHHHHHQQQLQQTSSFLTAGTPASHHHHLQHHHHRNYNSSVSSTAAAAAAGDNSSGFVSPSANFLATMWSHQNGDRPVKMAANAAAPSHAMRSSLRTPLNRDRIHERKVQSGSLRSAAGGRSGHTSCGGAPPPPAAATAVSHLLNCYGATSPLPTPHSAPTAAHHHHLQQQLQQQQQLRQQSLSSDDSLVPLNTLNETLVRHPEFFVVYSQQQQQQRQQLLQQHQQQQQLQHEQQQQQLLMLQAQSSPYIELSEPVYEEIDRDIQLHHQQHQQHQLQQLQQLQQQLAMVGAAGGQQQQLYCDDEMLARQSDMSRQSSRSYGDSRPLIAYETTAAAPPAAAVAQHYHHQQQQQQQEHHQQQQLMLLHRQHQQQHHHHQQQQQQQEQQQQQHVSATTPSILCETNLRHFDRSQVLADLHRLQYSGQTLPPTSTPLTTMAPPVSVASAHGPHAV